MPIVNLRENDSFDVALRRFKRACEKAGILSKLREIEHHEKRTTKRKREAAAAVKRELKRLKKEEEVLERNRSRRFNFDTMVTTKSIGAAEKATPTIAKEAIADEPESKATKSDENPTTE